MAHQEFGYTSAGYRVPAHLHLPEGTGPHPGVLLAPGRLREIEGLSFLAEACRDAGFVVLATRYRGMDMQTDDEDCRAGLDVLAERGDVDQARLAMVGHSRGAMASLRVAAADERVRSVVALQPVTDLARYVEATRDYAPSRFRALAGSLGATPEDDPYRYEALSALSRAAAITVPVLLVAGTMDLHSPVDHSRWMHQALLESGNTAARLEVIEGMGHFFEMMYAGYDHARIAALTTSWLTQTLQVGADRVTPRDEAARAAGAT